MDFSLFVQRKMQTYPLSSFCFAKFERGLLARFVLSAEARGLLPSFVQNFLVSPALVRNLFGQLIVIISIYQISA